MGVAGVAVRILRGLWVVEWKAPAEVVSGWPCVFWLTLSWRSKLRPPQAR